MEIEDKSFYEDEEHRKETLELSLKIVDFFEGYNVLTVIKSLIPTIISAIFLSKSPCELKDLIIKDIEFNFKKMQDAIK